MSTMFGFDRLFTSHQQVFLQQLNWGKVAFFELQHAICTGENGITECDGFCLANGNTAILCHFYLFQY